MEIIECKFHIHLLDPVYTEPDEFGNWLKFFHFRLFTREFVLLGGLNFVRGVFSCKLKAKTDEFQPGSNFVRYHVNGF